MEIDGNDSFEEKYLLVAKADNVKHISSLLKAVNFKDVSFSLYLYIISILNYTFYQIYDLKNLIQPNYCIFS